MTSVSRPEYQRVDGEGEVGGRAERQLLEEAARSVLVCTRTKALVVFGVLIFRPFATHRLRAAQLSAPQG